LDAITDPQGVTIDREFTDADVRVLMEHVLIGERYDVDPTGTVAAARTLLQRNHYDLVLADGVLPDGTGMAIANEAVRRGTPVIIVTAYAFRLPKHELARFELLLKPVRPPELLQAVERALEPTP
jgi:DNA-binding NtrC family response regulator